MLMKIGVLDNDDDCLFWLLLLLCVCMCVGVGVGVWCGVLFCRFLVVI